MPPRTPREDNLTPETKVKFSVAQMLSICGCIVAGTAWALTWLSQVRDSGKTTQLAVEAQTERLRAIETKLTSIDDHNRKTDEATTLRIVEWSKWRAEIASDVNDHERRIVKIEGR